MLSGSQYPVETRHDEKNLELDDSNSLSDDKTEYILRRLLRKADSEEMEIMHRILCNGWNSPEWRVAVATLTEEMAKERA